MHVLYKLKNTYISKHNESTKVYAWRQVAQGCICIAINLDKIDIYMKLKHKHENMYNMKIQVKMFESSKLNYTSTSNKYKWAFKYKHIMVYLWLTSCTSIYTSFNETNIQTSNQNMKHENQNKTCMLIM